MINNRRNFLKKSAGAIAGAGIVSSFISKYSTGFTANSSEKINSKKKIRWGMVIDMKKCVDGCVKCIDACHDKHNVPEVNGAKVLRRELKASSFKRQFTLGEQLDGDNINASFKDGILSISVPKTEPEVPKVTKVAIK